MIKTLTMLEDKINMESKNAGLKCLSLALTLIEPIRMMTTGIVAKGRTNDVNILRKLAAPEHKRRFNGAIAAPTPRNVLRMLFLFLLKLC